MNLITITKTCPFCGTESFVKVNKSAYNAWREGMTIQTAMPNMTAEKREILISGICLKCQTDIFG